MCGVDGVVIDGMVWESGIVWNALIEQYSGEGLRFWGMGDVKRAGGGAREGVKGEGREGASRSINKCSDRPTNNGRACVFSGKLHF